MAVVYYARVDYVYSGGDRNFSIPFSYIKPEHIIVVKNNDEENLINNFSFLTSNQITIADELTIDDVISIRRVTPLDVRAVIFDDSTVLDEECQNLSADQVFKAVQEVEDREKAFEIKITQEVANAMMEALNHIETAEGNLEVHINQYVTQQTYAATSTILSQCYSKAESDILFATNTDVNALDTAYNSTLDSINAVLNELLNGSTSYTAYYKIAEPKIALNDILEDNEIWLEGEEVLIEDYPLLYAAYGDTYGRATQAGCFKLPDFRNRVMWGGSTFGYLNPTLPNITATFGGLDNTTPSGAIRYTRSHEYGGVEGDGFYDAVFNASWSNSIYQDGATVRPPAIKIRVKTRFR